MKLYENNNKGFTLIELLVVISIIGLLSSVVLASLNTARGNARNAKRQQDLIQIRSALELYALDNGGRYPSTGGYTVVYGDPGCSTTGGTSNWIPGLVPNYIATLPSDPRPAAAISNGVSLGNSHPSCYVYSSDGKTYILSAYGTVENTNISTSNTFYSKAGFREIGYQLGSGANSQYCYYMSNPSGGYFDVVRLKSYTLTNLNIPSSATDGYCSNFSI